MNNKKILGLALLLIAIIAVVVIIRTKTDNAQNSEEAAAVALEGDPVDTILDFYQPWLRARLASETNPFADGLATHESLSPDMHTKLQGAQAAFDQEGTDPVLCQGELPEAFRTKKIFEENTSAQYLVLGRGVVKRPIAIVHLGGVDGHWKITNIDCNAGEIPPEMGEFNFDHTGFLLKHSVKPPLDPNNWYVVYEQNGILGYTAVLNFNETSTCLLPDGNTTACGDETFAEAMKVHVQGNMQETGVDVVRVTIEEQ